MEPPLRYTEGLTEPLTSLSNFNQGKSYNKLCNE